MKNTKTDQLVSRDVTLEFVDAEGAAAQLQAGLSYDPADPYAVTVIFRTGVSDVAWTFGRDLLIEGRYDPQGDGDVHVWPCLASDGRAVVIIELSSPDGEVMVQAAARDIDTFVAQMLHAVPQGLESARVDFESELAGLLSR